MNRSVDANHADELWERIRVGDADAFGVLFARHARAIYNYCFRRTADWALAEDLTSIVFLEAWRRRDKELRPDKVLPMVVRNREQRRPHSATVGPPPGGST